jgi:Dihydrofolate reductase
MTISIITAMDRNGLIGSNNKLPWHIPADLKYFKRITTGNTVDVCYLYELWRTVL